MDMEYIVRSSEDYGYTKGKLCSIVRVIGARKDERLGKNSMLVFHAIPIEMKCSMEYTVTMIQSVFVPTV
jgi:hypothetical protein